MNLKYVFAAIALWFSVSIPAAISETKTVVKRGVSIAAASDLKFALDELISEIKRETPDLNIKVTYGSSGNFFAQLSNNAPFDLYLSADIAFPRKLIEAGKAVKGSEFLYAVGQIVLWVPTSSKIDLEKEGIKSLLNPLVKKIAIANPAHAPYGRAAEAAMKKLGVYEAAMSKLVLGENISQTAQFVESGAADIGIIALSLAKATAMKEKGRYWEVPLDSYPPLEQGGIVLSWAKDAEAAKLVRDRLMNHSGQELLKKFGFRRPGN